MKDQILWLSRCPDSQPQLLAAVLNQKNTSEQEHLTVFSFSSPLATIMICLALEQDFGRGTEPSLETIRIG